jgi:arabinan endo-1,5-alpha-L-arabinosidase
MKTSFLITIGLLTLLGLAGCSSVVAPANDVSDAAMLAQAGSRGIRVHDPSTIVQCNGEYWVFYTGRGVPSYHSKDLVTWERGPVVFTNAPAWVAATIPENRNGMNFWAPDVIHDGDRYLLYYSVSTFGNNNSAIGLATSPTLDPNDPQYHWTDEGIVVQSHTNENFNTIDPAVTRDSDGNLWLSFGSFWSGIKLIQLDPATGKRLTPDSRMYALANHDTIESSYIYPHNGRYYLFANWGDCCRGTNSTYEIRVGRSNKITGPYVDKAGKYLLHDGGSLVLGTTGPFIGPGHAGIITADGKDWFSCHFYYGTRRGTAELAVRPIIWDADGWPKVGLNPPK